MSEEETNTEETQTQALDSNEEVILDFPEYPDEDWLEGSDEDDDTESELEVSKSETEIENESKETNQDDQALTPEEIAARNKKFREQRKKKKEKEKKTGKSKKTNSQRKANETNEAEFLKTSTTLEDEDDESEEEELTFLTNSVGTLRKAYLETQETESSAYVGGKNYVGLEPPVRSSQEDFLRRQRPKSPSTSMEVKNRFAVSKGIGEGVLLKQASKKFAGSFQENKKQIVKGKETFALHIACLLGQADVASELIKSGAKIHQQNKAGYYPIHYAVSKASNAHSQIVQMLTNNGAKFDVKANHTGETPLHYAILKAAPTKIPFTIQLVLHASQHKIDFNQKDTIYGQTPLHYACKLGFFQAAKLLLAEKRIICHTPDNNGYTPLHLAILANSVQCVDLLITKSPSISDVTNWGETALHLACKVQNPPILRLLMGVLRRQPSNFSIISKKDNKGFTPIHYAALQSSIGCLQMFPHFAELEDNIGLSPIFWSSLKGHRVATHHLLAQKVGCVHPQFGDVHYPMGNDFEAPLFSERFSDLKIIVHNQKLPVHRVLLGRCLPQYSMGFETEVALQQEVDERQVKEFLKFIYTGKIPESIEEKNTLRDIACIFGIPLLQSLLETAILTGQVDRTSNLTLYLGDILTTGKYSDVLINVEGKGFLAHRIVLSCRSAYFHELFDKNPNERVFNIPSGISKAMFSILLEYMYTDSIKKASGMTTETLFEVWELAKAFNLPALAFRCELFLYEKISPENVESIYLLSENNDMPTLKEGVIEYLLQSYKNLKKGNFLDQLATPEHSKSLEKKIKKREKEEKKKKTKPEPQVTHAVFFNIDEKQQRNSPSLRKKNKLDKKLTSSPSSLARSASANVIPTFKGK